MDEELMEKNITMQPSKLDLELLDLVSVQCILTQGLTPHDDVTKMVVLSQEMMDTVRVRDWHTTQEVIK